MTWTREKSVQLPRARIESICCRECGRRVILMDDDPLPPGWRTVPRGGARNWATARGSEKCDYVCRICAQSVHSMRSPA